MSNILSVPYFRQLGDGYCLPACVQMVLAYWGVNRDQLQLGRQLQIIQGAGVPAPRLLWLARGDLDVRYQPGTMADLENALRQGIPPIIPLHTSQLPHWDQDFAHAVVVVGINEDHVFVHDPAKEQPGIAVSQGDFHLAWDEMDNWFALLQVK